LRQQYLSQQSEVTAEIKQKARNYARARKSYSLSDSLGSITGLLCGAFFTLETKKEQ
jgi:hypothetical protein